MSAEDMYIIKTPVCLAKNRLLVCDKCILRKLIHIFCDIFRNQMLIFIKSHYFFKIITITSDKILVISIVKSQKLSL